MRAERASLILVAAGLLFAGPVAVVAQGIAPEPGMPRGGAQGAVPPSARPQVPAAAPGDAAPLPGDAAPLQLVVNGVAQDVVTTRLAPDGDVWVPLGPLGSAGLRGLRGTRREVDGWTWVSLRSLAPEIAFTLDEATLELRVDAVAGMLGRTAMDLGANGRPVGLVTGGSPSAFANYAVQADEARRVSAFAELGGGAGGWLASTGVSRTGEGRVVRGLSAVTREDPSRLLRWTAGDGVASGGPLGGTLVLGGLGVERDFALDPWFVRQPTPRATAVALTPSTVEVYVNGRLVRKDKVGPGTLDLGNLPVEAGAGSVRTVVRDAYGRTQELDSRYYYSAGLLAPGVDEWALHAGARRDSFASASGAYGEPIALGRYRFGWSDTLTFGGRAEASPSLASLGPSITAGLPLGQVEASVAVSAASGAAGAAASGAWSWLGRGTSAGLRLAALTDSYAHASLGARQDRAVAQAGAFVSFALPWSSTLGLDLSAQRTRDLGDGGGAALRGSLSLGRGASLLASAGWNRVPGSPGGFEASVLFLHAFGNGTSASASADRVAARGGSASARLERSLPVGDGVGYRVEGGTGDARQLSGAFSAQGPIGRAEVSYQRSAGLETGFASVAGGVVVMGGEAFLARPVQDGYALVQVPGVEGVRTYLNEQEVGRTNGRGNLLVPGLLPYHANKLSIRGADVPMEYSLESVERLVAPPRRIGARVRFDVQKITTVTGTLSVKEPRGEVTPAWGELRVAEPGVESVPIASDGRFYVSNLRPGRHPASIDYAGGTCGFALEVPETAGALVDVGAVRCVSSVAAGAPVPAGAPSASTVNQTTSPGGAGN